LCLVHRVGERGGIGRVRVRPPSHVACPVVSILRFPDAGRAAVRRVTLPEISGATHFVVAVGGGGRRALAAGSTARRSRNQIETLLGKPLTRSKPLFMHLS